MQKISLLLLFSSGVLAQSERISCSTIKLIKNPESKINKATKSSGVYSVITSTYAFTENNILWLVEANRIIGQMLKMLLRRDERLF